MSGRKIVFTVINDLRSDQRMDKICSALQDAGYSVTLVGRLLPDSPPLKLRKYAQVRIPCYFTKGKLFYLEYNLRLLFRLPHVRADAYSAVDMDTLWPVVRTGKKLRKKIVFDAHEYFSEVPEVISRPWVQRFWQYWEKKWIPKTDLAYTVNQSLADIFQQKFGKPFGVIRNVPLRQATVSNPDPDFFILYQGALNTGRGLEGLIRSMPQIPCRLKIAGEGELLPKLQELTQTLKVTDRVEFLGFLPPEKLKELTGTAGIGYNVSENMGQSYYFSLNNKFFDYIQAGLPALTNDFPEYLAHLSIWKTGITVQAPEPECIVPAVQQLINNPLLMQELRDNCHKAAAEWNWEQEKDKLIALYQKLWD